MPSSPEFRGRPVLLSSFWAFCLLICVGYIAYDNYAPPNPAAGYHSEVASGWDIRVTCAASKTYVKGLDPYRVENFHDKHITLPYIYPPLFLDVFRPACLITPALDSTFKVVYPLLGLAAALLLGNWKLKGWRRVENLTGTLTIVFGGFAGFFWTLKTGNAALFIGLFTAAAICLFRLGTPSAYYSDKINLYDLGGAVLLGLALSIKFIYAPVIFALIFLPRTLPLKLKLISLTTTTFLAPFLISISFYTNLVPSFLASLFGRIPGQYAPSKEACNPSLYCLTDEISKRYLGLTSVNALTLMDSIVFVFVIISFSFILFTKLRNLSSNDRLDFRAANDILIQNPDFAHRVTMFSIFVVMLLMFRVKEYGYFPEAIVVAPLLVELPLIETLISGASAVLFPLLTNQPRLAWHSMFFNYDQVLAALAIYTILAFTLFTQTRNQPT